MGGGEIFSGISGDSGRDQGNVPKPLVDSCKAVCLTGQRPQELLWGLLALGGKAFQHFQCWGKSTIQ